MGAEGPRESAELTTGATMGAKKAKKKATRKPAEAAERSANRALVERTIELLLAHDRATTDSERAIGEHLLDAYFGGAEGAQSKSPRKTKSYALLASRAKHETTWDESAFRRAVKVAIAWRSLPPAVRTKLEARSLYRLASIDDVARRREVGAKIAREGLSTRQADVLIAAAGAREQRGGRRAAPPARQLASAIEREIEAVTLRSVDDDLDDDERGEVGTRLREAARRLIELAARLTGRR